jgi:hypothetical protein
MMFILIMFIVLVGGGWLIGKLVANALFPDKEIKPTYTFIDKSVHYHKHEHKNISIIDDATKKIIFELKDQN